MRISPATPRIPSNQPTPTEADRAQAVAIADVLAGLIGNCDAQLAALDADAAEATHDGHCAPRMPSTPSPCKSSRISNSFRRWRIDWFAGSSMPAPGWSQFLQPEFGCAAGELPTKCLSVFLLGCNLRRRNDQGLLDHAARPPHGGSSPRH